MSWLSKKYIDNNEKNLKKPSNIGIKEPADIGWQTTGK